MGHLINALNQHSEAQEKFLINSESQRRASAMFMPAHSREKGSLSHGSQGLWPPSQGKPPQGYGWGMRQAILAEEGILTSSVQSPRPHVMLDIWLFTYAPPHSNTAVTMSDRKIVGGYSGMYHSAVAALVGWN